MPIVGHVADKRQIVACDFRQGNTPPAKQNLGFIRRCAKSLLEDCLVQSLRIDSSGYQKKIIHYCDDFEIKYAIRAKARASLKVQIEVLAESDWQSLRNKKGEPVSGSGYYAHNALD
jgi:hypothetical protein